MGEEIKYFVKAEERYHTVHVGEPYYTRCNGDWPDIHLGWYGPFETRSEALDAAHKATAWKPIIVRECSRCKEGSSGGSVRDTLTPTGGKQGYWRKRNPVG